MESCSTTRNSSAGPKSGKYMTLVPTGFTIDITLKPQVSSSFFSNTLRLRHRLCLGDDKTQKSRSQISQVYTQHSTRQMVQQAFACAPWSGRPQVGAVVIVEAVVRW